MRVILSELAEKQLKGLDGSQRLKVAKKIKKLMAAPDTDAAKQIGLPLGARNAGTLTGLRKIYVDNRAIRIVYEVNRDNDVIVGWIIGERSDDECYRLAYDYIPRIGSDEHKALVSALTDAAFRHSKPGQ